MGNHRCPPRSERKKHDFDLNQDPKMDDLEVGDLGYGCFIIEEKPLEEKEKLDWA